MSCVLRIDGSVQAGEAFAEMAGLVPHPMWNDPRREKSSVRIIVSDAEFEDFGKQVTDAIVFLQERGDRIVVALSKASITEAQMDFAVAVSDDVFRTFSFPIELIALASSARVSLAISPYPQ